MANPGAKFVSVNLNKSYGQHHHPSHHTHYNGGGGGSGPYSSFGRGRPGNATAGGGMVVLSRNRGGAPKSVAKLSVPPPLNLPSLRKEHEKFDTSGTGGGPGGGAGTGSGSRPSSSGVGWTKPVVSSTVLPEKNEIGVEPPGVDGIDTDGVTRAAGSYMPPSARLGGVGAVGSSTASRDFVPSVGKAMVLRGEDFPSLQAARPTSSGTSQKQKDGLNQKQKQFVGGESAQDKREEYHLGPMVDVQSSLRSVDNVSGGHGISSRQMADQTRKQESYFPDPLPLVRLKPRSDWADDERDTGHAFVERGRDVGYSKSESYWDSDFDMPRPSVLPHKPSQNQYGRWGQRDNETGNRSSSEVLRVDPYPKEARVPSREGREVNRWRNSTFQKDGNSFQDIGNDRTDIGSRITGYNNMAKDNRYATPHHGDTVRDPSFGKRDFGIVGRQQWNNSLEYNNRGTDNNTRDRHFSEQSNRYRGENFQSNTLSKSSFASNGKVTHVADPILTMGRDKRYSKGDRSFSEDPFGSDSFDESDLFSGGLVGVVKRKKDATKSTDYHDPVRESFEAELERVQQMQELERQKIIQEQERALEQTRREEEERLRKIRDEEERQKKLEEESRKALWRAEQERLEAIRKAEELRISREEEKRKLDLEEERRKQAAKQKLLELEARIAKRQAEAAKGDVSLSSTVVDEKLEAAMKVKEVPRSSDLDTWEDGERLVEKVTASAMFDSSAYGRSVEMSSRPYAPRDGSSNLVDRGKAINSWRRDMFESGDSFSSPLLDQEIGHYNSPRRDAIGGGRAVPRRDFHGGAGYMPPKSFTKTVVQEPYLDEFGYQKDQRWNLSGDADVYGKFREMDSEFPDGVADDKYGDNGWGQGQFRNSTHNPYPDRLYPHPEANELYPYGRSRYSLRQPRVLPPPLASAQRTNFRGTTERPGPSTFLDKDIHHMHASRSESSRQTYYYGNNQGGLEPSEMVGMQQENTTTEDQKLDNAPRCDSQSSLSVSSPPTSPPQLSHDELDESGDSRVTSAVAEGKRSLLIGSGSVLNDNSEKGTVVIASDSISAVEDEEWTSEIDDTLQQQEEYDEEEDGYREEDELREGDIQNLALNQKFEEPENVVLGFDEGVEVVIPSDDFEKSTGNQERSFDSCASVPSNAQSLIYVENSSGTSADSFTEKTELTLQASPNQSVGLPAQHTIPSSDGITVAAGPTSLPNLSSTGISDDIPVQLQFGLFSGPSLIPSPVPSIQIGSIQMPLHIHPPLGSSIAQMHPSQTPMFQFGQLRYTAAVPHGILPMPPQPVSFVQPTLQGHFNLNKNVIGSVPQPAQNASAHNVSKEEVPPAPEEQSDSVGPSTSSGVSTTISNKFKSEFGSQVEGGEILVSKSYLPSMKGRGTDNQFEVEHIQQKMQSVPSEKKISGPRGLGMSSGGRGRKFAYALKNPSTRSSYQAHDVPSDSNGFQRRPQRAAHRTEFRVRESYERRQAPSLDNTGLDDNSNYIGNTRSGSKRGTTYNRARTMKQRTESEPFASGNVNSQGGTSGDRAAKDMVKSLPVKSHNISHSGDMKFRKHFFEEDVDVPLQSGVVRVFKQSGIEAPSDEDDFIEVRSKRQVLNDRREQREKEIKAKSRIIKPPRKPRSTNQNVVTSRSQHNKLYVALGSEESSKSHLDFTASESPRLNSVEVSKEFTTAVSKPLAPIGIPAGNSEAQAIKHPQAGPVSVDLDSGTEHEADLMFESKNKVADKAQSSSTTWTTSGINQQVMSLTQTQLDEAMKPARYDSHISTVGGHSCTISDPILPTPPILTKDKTFSSGTSPVNSLLAGEKIQFGAVTSPTILPTSRVVSHGIGPPGSNRLDVQMTRSFTVAENENSIFFEKEKHPTESSLQDSEAEAEAAASAVAVAAISSDEMVGNNSGSASITGTKGTVRDQQLASQSRGEELLSVSLPADLSVETTPISLWPPLPSPHSHFPGGTPSPFPFYEINPMLGGPIFAYSPHEETSNTKSHPQSSTATTSGPLGNWQHHSGVDSFYGTPAGFHGPFISPPGGIPGVQGPPHMVVYNHFAPVGQYGQVGLSFMGTTYIPSGKQADWKHTPSSSVAEGDISNMNMNSVQHNAPIQHLAPGSPLLPMGSPLPMFDVSPFQNAPDLSAQARWGHIPPSQIHSVPVSRPLHSQVEGALNSQVSQGHTIGQSATSNRFPESRSPAPSDSSPTFTVASDMKVAPFPAEMGIVASSGQQSAVVQSSSAEDGKSGTLENRHDNNGKHPNAGPVKAQLSQKNTSTTHQGNSSGYNYRRGDVSHKNNPGSEWPHRRMGFHGRNQNNGPATKIKQIYVAKQTPTGSSTN